MSFTYLYHRWAWLQSVVLVCLVLLSVVSVGGRWTWLAMAVWGGASLPCLFVLARKTSPDQVGPMLPNALTAVRLAAAVGLLLVVWYRGLLPAVRVGSSAVTGQWVLLIVLAAAEVTDLFDGRIARRLGARAFGSIWDMENDAYFTLSLAVAVWQIERIHPFVLIIGLMRYAYFLLWRYDGDPPEYPRLYKLFAKTVAAALVVTLIAAFAPILPHAVKTAALALALTLQIASFCWDLVLQRRSAAVRRSAEG